MAPPADVDSDSDRSESPPPHPPWLHARQLEDVPVLDHGLRELRICLVDPATLGPCLREFAMLIDRLFPNLDLADPQYPAGFQYRHRSRMRYGNWPEVEQMLLALRFGRTGAHRAEKVTMGLLEGGIL